MDILPNAKHSTLFMLGNLGCFMASAFQTYVFPNILSEISSVSNSLDQNHPQHSVGPDLGPNCLHGHLQQVTLAGKKY